MAVPAADAIDASRLYPAGVFVVVHPVPDGGRRDATDTDTRLVTQLRDVLLHALCRVPAPGASSGATRVCVAHRRARGDHRCLGHEPSIMALLGPTARVRVLLWNSLFLLVG